MTRLLAPFLLLTLACQPAFADGPKFGRNGGVGSATSVFTNGEPTGGAFSINGTTGKATFPTINILAPSPPATPANGDMWVAPNGVFAQVGGTTVNVTQQAPVAYAAMASSIGAL